MASQPKNLQTLISTKVPLTELVIGKTMQHVMVRILRMWEARNPKQNGALMSLDFLLLDEKETLIQGSIYYRRIDRFKEQLKEGNVYLLHNFEIVPSYHLYKVTDHPFTLRFLDTTHITKLDEEVPSIKLEKFRLQSSTQFQAFADTKIHLFDVVGQILQINGSNLQDSSSVQKIVLLLLLEDNTTIRVTLWDGQASAFRQEYHATCGKKGVVVCTFLNPMTYGGNLYLNSSSATKIYMNYGLAVVKEFMRRMGIENNLPPPTIVEAKNDANSMEIWDVAKMLEYISSGANEEREVICQAKVMSICSRNGWSYLSCTSCPKKLGQYGTTVTCNYCQKTITTAVARFRVELEVENCGTTTFVLFDRDVKKITNTTAEELRLSEEIRGQDTSNLTVIPQCLYQILGKKMEFQVKITEYNFKTSNQTFTVSRIIKDNLVDEGMPSKDTQTKEKERIKTEDGKKLPTYETEDEKKNKKIRYE